MFLARTRRSRTRRGTVWTTTKSFSPTTAILGSRTRTATASTTGGRPGRSRARRSSMAPCSTRRTRTPLRLPERPPRREDHLPHPRNAGVPRLRRPRERPPLALARWAYRKGLAPSRDGAAVEVPMVAPSDAVRPAATSAKSPSAAMIGLVMVLSSLTLVVLAPPASAVDFFYDGFEAGLGLWTVTGTGPPVEWHQANDTVDLCFGAPGHPAGAFAGNSTAAFHRDDVTPLTCTYATAGIVRGDLMLTTPVALPVTTPLRLRFASWHDTEADLFDDTLLAYVSNDSGLSWIVVSNIKGDGHPMQTWNDVQVGLDAYAGEAVQVRFSFDMFDNTANNFAGWHVDEVRLDDQPVMADTMTVLPTVLAPASVAAGTGDVAMLGLNLTAFPGTVNVVRVTVQLNGSPPDPADIPLIELWRDTGDGLFGLGDTLLASGTFGGGPPWEASLLTTPVAVGAGGITLFVTFDIAASAVDAHWVGAHLPDATYIGVTGGAVAPTGFPIDSYQPGIRTEIPGLPGPPAPITSPADQIW